MRFQDGRLRFRFDLAGQLGGLKIGAAGAADRTNGLWNSTCFEVFLRQSGADGYLEYNFAPSSAWAAYLFEDYRTAMVDFPVDAPPAISSAAREGHFALEAQIMLPVGWRGRPIEINLSAVVEETDGTKSYWALAHPPGKPDFHDKDCFALKLDAPSAT